MDGDPTLMLRLIEVAQKDEKFLADFIYAGGTAPGIFSDRVDKCLFGTTYVGWFLGKHGPIETKAMLREIK